jgi:hypothetical protein
MKKTASTQKGEPLDARTGAIMKALRDARKAAVKLARMHGTAIVYRKDGKLVRERP